MKSIVVFTFVALLSFAAIAQKKNTKIFRPTYFNFGVNIPGESVSTLPLLTNNVQQNFLAGYMGTRLGYLFELGTKFYFNGSGHKLRYGLDWTFLSLAYNETEWGFYEAAKTGHAINTSMESAATKLGPVISYNIIKKLVADIHFQVAPTLQYSDFSYSKRAGESVEQFYFDENNVWDIYGIKTSWGAGVHWGVIGLSADYFSGSTYAYYRYTNTSTGEGIGNSIPLLKKKNPGQSIQLKFSLNL